MRRYEITYILDPTIKEDQVDEIVQEYEKLLKDHGAEVELIEKWGMRRLAYRVQRFSEGIYVYMEMSGEHGVLSEVDRRMRLSDVVIRHLIVRTDIERKRADKLALKRGIPPAVVEEVDRGAHQEASTTSQDAPEPAAPEEGAAVTPAPDAGVSTPTPDDSPDSPAEADAAEAPTTSVIEETSEAVEAPESSETQESSEAESSDDKAKDGATAAGDTGGQ